MNRRKKNEGVSLTFSLAVGPYDRRIAGMPKERNTCRHFVGGSGGNWMNQRLELEHRVSGSPRRKLCLDDIAHADIALSCFGKWNSRIAKEDQDWPAFQQAEGRESNPFLVRACTIASSADMQDLIEFYRPFSTVTLWDYISKYLQKAGEAYLRLEEDLFGDNDSLISEMAETLSHRSSSSPGSDWCLLDGQSAMVVEDWQAL